MRCWGNINLEKHYLIIGANYLITSSESSKIIECKFIKVTRKGYNFLVIDKNRCLFKKHLYPISTPEKASEGDWFWLLSYIQIRKIRTYLEYKKSQILNGKDYSWEDFNKI